MASKTATRGPRNHYPQNDTHSRRKPGPAPNPRSQGRIARRLGVSREHLNRVLNGSRTSHRLLTRYNELRAHHFHEA